MNIVTMALPSNVYIHVSICVKIYLNEYDKMEIKRDCSGMDIYVVCKGLSISAVVVEPNLGNHGIYSEGNLAPA